MVVVVSASRIPDHEEHDGSSTYEDQCDPSSTGEEEYRGPHGRCSEGVSNACSDNDTCVA